MTTANDRLRKQAKKVTKGLHELRGTAKDAARETLRHIRENGLDRYAQGRGKVHQAEHAIEKFIQKRPLKSVLIAVGVGVVLGGYCLRCLATARGRTKSAA